MLINEIKNIDSSKKALKKFGITIGLFIIILNLFLLLIKEKFPLHFLFIGLAIIILGFLYPKLLKPINIAWMSIALMLGWISTRLILILLYYFLITPISFVTKLLRKDLLEMKVDKSKASYWHKREPMQEKSYFENQF